MIRSPAPAPAPAPVTVACASPVRMQARASRSWRDAATLLLIATLAYLLGMTSGYALRVHVWLGHAAEARVAP